MPPFHVESLNARSKNLLESLPIETQPSIRGDTFLAHATTGMILLSSEYGEAETCSDRR